PAEAADDLFFEEPAGPLVLPGVYRVALAKRVEGVVTPLAEPREFRIVIEGAERMDLADRTALFEFQRKVARLDRAVAGGLDAANELNNRLGQLQRAADATPGVEPKWQDAVRSLQKRNRAIL